MAPPDALHETPGRATRLEIVGGTFWASLDEREKAVLPTCILILIEQGRVSFYFPQLDKMEA